MSDYWDIYFTDLKKRNDINQCVKNFITTST